MKKMIMSFLAVMTSISALIFAPQSMAQDSTPTSTGSTDGMSSDTSMSDGNTNGTDGMTSNTSANDNTMSSDTNATNNSGDNDSDDEDDDDDDDE